MKRYVSVLLFFVASTAAAASFSERGRFLFPVSVTDLAARDGIVLVGSFDGRVFIIDATNPVAPQQIGTFQPPAAHGYVADIEWMGSVAVIAYIRDGMSILDLRNLREPREIAFYSAPEGIHSVEAAGTLVYAVDDSRTQKLVHVLDLSVPAQPREIYTYTTPHQPHEVTVVGTRAYFANIGGSLQVVDVSDPVRPVVLATKTYANAVTHTAWPSPDGRRVVTTDEGPCGGATVKIWDITDLQNITLVSEYIAASSDPNPEVPHQVRWEGRFLYLSYYTRGVRVVDVSDPAQPKEAAAFGTDFSPVKRCGAGAWGIDLEPSARGVRVYASDMGSGLWIFDHELPIGARRRAASR